jgi:hypothetical protein
MITRKLFVPTTALLLSPFDADSFMGQSIDAPLDTVIKQVPEGDYRAMIGEFDSEKGFRTFEVKKQTSKKFGQEMTIFQPPFILQDDPRLAEVLEARGNEQVTVYHKGIFLDLTDEGGLDTGSGKNVDLGRLRDAVGQNNKAGWKFTDLIGAGPVMVRVVHEADQNDETKKFARVSRVVKIS